MQNPETNFTTQQAIPTRLLVQLYWKFQAFNDRLNFEILREFELEVISSVLVGPGRRLTFQHGN
jgi:hypothetical protein